MAAQWLDMKPCEGSYLQERGLEDSIIRAFDVRQEHGPVTSKTNGPVTSKKNGPVTRGWTVAYRSTLTPPHEDLRHGDGMTRATSTLSSSRWLRCRVFDGRIAGFGGTRLGDTAHSAEMAWMVWLPYRDTSVRNHAPVRAGCHDTQEASAWPSQRAFESEVLHLMQQAVGDSYGR